MNEVNNEGDSSDSENENDVNESADDDDDLSFLSDDEGNYHQQQKHESEDAEREEGDDAESEEEADGSEEEEAEDVSDVEGESAYVSDDSEELSFDEDESDGENEKPSNDTETTKQNGNASSKLTSNSKIHSTKEQQKSSEPGSLLRVNKNSKQHSTNAVEAFKSELKQSGSSSSGGGTITGPNATTEIDEYEKFDTDDEEDIRNTVGNIPMQWYDEYKHIGYDWDAKKIIKPPKRDQLDDFLKRMEDPNFWRTVKDPQTGQDVILSDADIDLIKRINSQRVPDTNFDEYTVSDCILFI